MFLLALIGGGGNKTVSKNTVDILNNTVNDIRTEIKNVCSAKSRNEQTINIKVGQIIGCNTNISGFDQTINSNLTSDCSSKMISYTE